MSPTHKSVSFNMHKMYPTDVSVILTGKNGKNDSDIKIGVIFANINGSYNLIRGIYGTIRLQLYFRKCF